MKYKFWKLLVIVFLGNILLSISGSALAPSLPFWPDFLDRYTVYPKQLFVEVNIPERALYLFQIYNEQQYLINKYPCAIGTMEYKTPEGNFIAQAFRWNPGWTPPESKWAENLEAVEPGQGSPLGCAALTVDWEKAILIHGSRNKNNLGKPVSHGCIRLLNKDMTELLSYLQDNVPNTLGKAKLEKYQVSANQSYWGYFRRPVSVKLIYRRLNKKGTEVFFHPDIYSKESYKPPMINIDSVLAEQKISAVQIANYLKEQPPRIGQEHFTKVPYPYRGRKRERRYFALVKDKLFANLANIL